MSDSLKIFIWVIGRPAKDYGERPTGARFIIAAKDIGQAMQQMDKMLPKGVTVTELSFRADMHRATPQVFDADGFTYLDLSDGYKTASYIQGTKLGSSGL